MMCSLKTTHEKVRKRALGLVAVWTADFERDPSLGVMEECYNNLKAKSKSCRFPFPQLLTVPKIISFSHQMSLLRLLSTMRCDGGRRRNFNASWKCLCLTRVAEPSTPTIRHSRPVEADRALAWVPVPVPPMLWALFIHQAMCLHRIRRDPQHLLPPRCHRKWSLPQHLYPSPSSRVSRLCILSSPLNQGNSHLKRATS